MSAMTKNIYLEARQCMRRGWFALSSLPFARLTRHRCFLMMVY